MAEALSHGAAAIHLSIWSGNEDALRFYARYGVARTADIAFWVGDRRVEELLSASALKRLPQSVIAGSSAAVHASQRKIASGDRRWPPHAKSLAPFA
jgi:hypothetical protein